MCLAWKIRVCPFFLAVGPYVGVAVMSRGISSA